MKLSEELAWRGFINQTTLEDISQLNTMDITFYHGFDASADSQTIGNLAAMMLDMVFMRHGAKAILLAGGATSLLGDPGGKDSERPLQSAETIRHNIACAENQLKNVFKDQQFTLVNNLDWFSKINVLDFMRDTGKHFGMSTLVQRDYIAKRIGEGGNGMSYTEFSYTLLQGYDYLHLYRNYGCNLQLAGSDQWGNALSGVDLIRRTEGAETHVLTLPLVINRSTGKKFGKSENGAIWLNPEKTSPYKFYQFWLNTDDEGSIDYMKLYTTLDRKAIETIHTEHQQNPGARIAQKHLAREVTAFIHGKERCEAVERVTGVLFGGIDVTTLSQEELDILSAEIPVVHSSSTVQALVDSKTCNSNGEARRLILGNAISINGHKISQDSELTTPCIIKKGKNTFILVR